MKITVAGTGLPALIVAHAATKWSEWNGNDLELTIYGEHEPYVPLGAKWFETAIPDILVPSAIVETQSVGDPEDYISKICSPISPYNQARADFYAYDYHSAHEQLSSKYHNKLFAMSIDRKTVQEYPEVVDVDYVFNTMPRPIFYPQASGSFSASRQWRLDEGREKGIYSIPGENGDRNVMIYDGTLDTSWYRISQLFGLISVEWPFNKKPPISGVYLEILPLGAAPDLGLEDVRPGWRGTKAMAHFGPLAQWRPSTDIGSIFGEVLNILNTFENP